MGSGHGHEVTATGAHRKRLIVVLVITGAVLIAAVIGGLIARVAGRRWPYTDRLGGADHGAHRGLPRDPTWNNETHLRTPAPRGARGLANALLRAGVAVWVLIKAVDRLRNPVEIDSRLWWLSSESWPTWPDYWCSARRRRRA